MKPSSLQSAIFFRGSGKPREICILPPLLLKSSAVPSYHPRTTCSSGRTKKRNEESGMGKEEEEEGSSPTQAVTMATVPSCCLLSLAHSLFEGSTCASGQARQQDSDPLGSPWRVDGRGGLGKRLSITPGDGVVFCCCLIPSPSFFPFFFLFSNIFVISFLLQMPCVLREWHRVVFVANQDGRKKTDDQDVDVSFPNSSEYFFFLFGFILGDVEMVFLTRSRLNVSAPKIAAKIPFYCIAERDERSGDSRFV